MNAPIDVDTWKFTPGIDEDDDNDYAPREQYVAGSIRILKAE